MRTSAVTALLFATCLLLSLPATAGADTGGDPLYMSNGRSLFRASAAHPEDRHRLALPWDTRDAEVNSVVPSPDGRHLAIAMNEYAPRARVRVFVTDARGLHAHPVFTRANGAAPPPNKYREWSTAGLAWAGGSHRLFFSSWARDGYAVDRITTRLWSVHVTGSGRRAGVASQVPGGKNLSYPTTDPLSGRVAAVSYQYDAAHCNFGSNVTTTSTIVLLDPSSGSRQDLLTVTTPPSGCPFPMEHLAWSPDGTQIAFDQIALHLSTGLYTGQINVVAVDGSDGDDPRVAVADDERHGVAMPTWRNAQSVWFARQLSDDGSTDNCRCTRPDLFSVSVTDTGFGAPVRRTRTPDFSEAEATFG